MKNTDIELDELNELDEAELEPGANKNKKPKKLSPQEFIHQTVLDTVGCDDEELLENSDILLDLEGDELDLYEVVFTVEDHFELPADEGLDVAGVTTVGKLTDYLLNRIGANQ